MISWTHRSVGRAALLTALLALVGPVAFAQNSRVTLAWDPSSGDISGYRVYCGTSSGNYASMIDVGPVTEATISNLTIGVTYYFALTAYDLIGLESPFSNEISYTVPGITPTVAPVLRVCFSPGGQVALYVTGQPGHTYQVLSTWDSVYWAPVGTTTLAGDGAFGFVDYGASIFGVPTYKLLDVSNMGSPDPTVLLQFSWDGQEALDVYGLTGSAYDILSTQDLINWNVIATQIVDSSGSFEFVDPAPANPDNYPFPFYRFREAGSGDPAAPALQISYSAYGFAFMEAFGRASQTYDLLRSGDQINWTVASTQTADAGGTFTFSESAGGNYPFPFYKLRSAGDIAINLPLAFSYPTTGELVIDATGQEGHTYALLASRDLVTWTVVGTETAGPGGSCEFTDPSGTDLLTPFYMLREVPAAAPAAVTLNLGPNGEINLQASGPAGSQYEIQATEDFTSWQVISAATMDGSGALSFTDTNAASFPARFYRLHQPATPARGR